ncbi:hypothetical protein [Thermococcus sp. ES12]|uniref:hypothetical protein n=1 Tax=Thermococcus sp. ES12 TaxID=1638246 RepID=UPI00143225ED|nr:hypothetical protein [Thermococcus sp. ES12]NJE75953.1 hypothetical protein [Thermococcus sp. ES12]
MAIRIRKVEWGYYEVEASSGDFFSITFRYDSKRHKYIVRFDWTGKTKELTEKEGTTVMEFLDWLSTLAVEESFETQGA